MKGLICYHSNSGNTKLTCAYIAQQLQTATFTCVDVVQDPIPDLNNYDVVGFASWTFFLGIPPFFHQFIHDLPKQAGKPAFIINTFGMMPGQALKLLDQAITAKGFSVIAGHSFHTPESYPPYIIKEWDNFDAPSPQEFEQFTQFIAQLEQKLIAISSEEKLSKTRLKIGLFNRLIRPYSLKKIRQQLGQLQIESDLCTDCGICQKVCLYQAIEMTPSPIINAQQCVGCWACFNHCPEKAIYTDRVKGTGHYPQPVPQFAAKLTTGS